MNIDKVLLAYKPISVTLNFDWENTTYDERVQMRHDYIEEQKKKDPNYVGYDVIEYFGSSHGPLKGPDVEYMVDNNRLVNTIGQVLSIWKGGVYISQGAETNHGYKHLYAKINGKRKTILFHRVIAGTFIPIPDELKPIRKELVVNHKNDDGCCNLRSNLEWCTQGINHRKAIETGAISLTNFKLTVKQPCQYYGKEYFFLCKEDLLKAGFNCGQVYVNSKIKGEYLCGVWEEVSFEECKDKQIGIPEDELKEITDKKYGQLRSRARVGTIVSEGPCKGQQFAIYGASQVKENGFDDGTVKRCCVGITKTHKGCTWEELPREKALTIPVGLTEAQKEHIFGKKQ